MHTQEKDFRKVLEAARNQRLQKMQQQQFYEEEDDGEGEDYTEAPRYEESPKQKKQTYKPQRQPIGKPMSIILSEKPHEKGGYGLVIIAIAIVLMTIATLVK